MRKSDSSEQLNPKSFAHPQPSTWAVKSLGFTFQHAWPLPSPVHLSNLYNRYMNRFSPRNSLQKTSPGRISGLQLTAENKTVLTGFSSRVSCQSWGQPTRPALTPAPTSAPMRRASTTKIASSVEGMPVCPTHGKHSQNFPLSLQNVTHHSHWNATFPCIWWSSCVFFQTWPLFAVLQYWKFWKCC